MSEYISIAEFAKRAGVSRQAVYSRLDRDLSSFVQVDNGKKTLNIRALELFSVKQDSQVDCSSSVKTLQDGITLEVIKTLQTQLAEKDKQIAEKDKQIAELQRQLYEARKSNDTLADKVGTALLNAQQSEQQAHALHAGTMQQAMIETRTATNETASAEQQERRGWKWWKGGNKQ